MAKKPQRTDFPELDEIDTVAEEDTDDQNEAMLLTQHRFRVVSIAREKKADGWWIEKTDAHGNRLVAGRSLSFGHPCTGTPFETERDAFNAAVAHVRSLQMTGSMAVLTLRDVPITVYLETIPKPRVDGYTSLKLDPRQNTVVTSMYAALRAKNVEVDGKPVDSIADVMKWLLNLIAETHAELMKKN